MFCANGKTQNKKKRLNLTTNNLGKYAAVCAMNLSAVDQFAVVVAAAGETARISMCRTHI